MQTGPTVFNKRCVAVGIREVIPDLECSIVDFLSRPCLQAHSCIFAKLGQEARFSIGGKAARRDTQALKNRF